MAKRITGAFLLVLTVIFQFFVFFSMLNTNETILRDGKEYKFEVKHIYAEDDRTLRLDFNVIPPDTDAYKKYAVFVPDEEENDGIIRKAAYFTDDYKAVKEGVVLRSASARYFRMPMEYYTLKIGDTDDVPHTGWSIDLFHKDRMRFYCTAQVLHGDAVITGLYAADGTPVEDTRQISAD